MGQITDNSKSRKQLEEEIEKLETVETNVARPALPTVKLEEISYTAPTDEYLKTVAAENLDKEHARQISEMQGEAKSLGDKRDVYASGLDKDIAALEDSRAKAARDIDDDMLKRGLARSSIAVGNKSELESVYLQKVSEIRGSYGKQISELDAEIASVDRKLKTALDDFNLNYATKLNAELAKLKTEREEKVREIVEFNNDVKAKQAQLDANKAKTESDLYTAALGQKQKASSLDSLSVEQREKIYKSVYDKIDEYLSSLGADQARLEIRNYAMYRSHLSDYYYYKLYDKYGR